MDTEDDNASQASQAVEERLSANQLSEKANQESTSMMTSSSNDPVENEPLHTHQEQDRVSNSTPVAPTTKRYPAPYLSEIQTFNDLRSRKESMSVKQKLQADRLLTFRRDLHRQSVITPNLDHMHALSWLKFKSLTLKSGTAIDAAFIAKSTDESLDAVMK